jgi:hypothetical protein
MFRTIARSQSRDSLFVVEGDKDGEVYEIGQLRPARVDHVENDDGGRLTHEQVLREALPGLPVEAAPRGDSPSKEGIERVNAQAMPIKDASAALLGRARCPLGVSPSGVEVIARNERSVEAFYEPVCDR